MEAQELLVLAQIIVGVLLCLGGWAIKAVGGRLAECQTRIVRLEVENATHREQARNISERLVQIEEKIDRLLTQS